MGEGGEEVVTKLLDDVARSEATEIRRRVATIASKAEEDERRCVQPVQHTDGITYTRCMKHMEITDESLGLAKPKAKAAKGPMRPEHDDVRMKPGLGLKQQPKQRQGLITNMFKKQEPAAAAEPETIDLS